MPNRREAITLLSTALAAVPVAGCVAPTAVRNVAQVRAVSAAQVLIDAAIRTRAVDVKFAIRYGDAVTGAYNAKTRIATYTNMVNTRQVLWATAERLYVGGASQVPEGSIALMAVPQMRAACRMSAGADVMVMTDMLMTTFTAEQTDTFTYSGSFDLGKVSGATNTMKSVQYYSDAAPGNTVVPFEATLDRSGYLAAVTAHFGVEHEFAYDLRLTEWGVPNAIKLPTSGIVEAPPSMYV